MPRCTSATPTWPKRSRSWKRGSPTWSTRCAPSACSPGARPTTPTPWRQCCRSSAPSSAWATPPSTPPDDTALTDLDRAIDVLVEMKNISEVAVGLAYSALVLRDVGLAAEVNHLEDRLDEMEERLELWVLRASQERVDPAPLRGLLHLAQ